MLTFCYLAAFNWWLVLCPSTLSHDWQMGSIPLLTSISDPRNLLTLWAFASTILMLHRSLLDFEVCIYLYLIKCLSIEKNENGARVPPHHVSFTVAIYCQFFFILVHPIALILMLLYFFFLSLFSHFRYHFTESTLCTTHFRRAATHFAILASHQFVCYRWIRCC